MRKSGKKLMTTAKWIRAVFPAFLVLTGCASLPKGAGRTIPQDHFAEIQRPDIPLEMNDRVQDWLDYFQGPGRERFGRYLTRSGKYIPMMRKILRQHGLPDNLVYLSMIESGFNPHAYSRARATGAWQFIYRTGLRYGLKVDSWIDERRDPEKSTVAAAKYLKDLYDRFNNWYLAAAGYNAGEGKIGRAIRKYATEDFWEIADRKYLRAETKNYVPKLIAAALISMNPEKYGFKGIRYEEPVRYDEATLEAPIDLRVAAKCAGVTYEEVKGLNPELLHWITPPEAGEYRLKIPHGTAEKFRQNLASLSSAERMGDQKLEVEAATPLDQLAKRHDVPVLLLAAANGLSSGDTVKAGQKIVLPYNPPEGEEFYEKVYERGGRHHHRGGKEIAYRVRNGDNISRISRRTGIGVSALRRNNPHVEWDRLKKGQRLSLYTSRGRATAKAPAAKKVASLEKDLVGPVPEPAGGYISHTIQSGDTLSEIAKKYNVSARQIRAHNKIASPKRLRPGKTLRIPVPQTASAGAATSM